MIKWHFSSNEPDRDIQNHITPIGKPFTLFVLIEFKNYFNVARSLIPQWNQSRALIYQLIYFHWYNQWLFHWFRFREGVSELACWNFLVANISPKFKKFKIPWKIDPDLGLVCYINYYSVLRRIFNPPDRALLWFSTSFQIESNSENFCPGKYATMVIKSFRIPEWNKNKFQTFS